MFELRLADASQVDGLLDAGRLPPAAGLTHRPQNSRRPQKAVLCKEILRCTTAVP